MRSDKQKAASARNHLILRLRGAYALFNQLGSYAGKDAVEVELTKLGAETEKAQRERMRQELIREAQGVDS